MQVLEEWEGWQTAGVQIRSCIDIVCGCMSVHAGRVAGKPRDGTVGMEGLMGVPGVPVFASAPLISTPSTTRPCRR